jgi:hypothetical protein
MKWCGLATSLRMSALGFNYGKGRAYSEPARLRDQFTGSKRLEAYLLKAAVVHLTAAVGDAANWACDRIIMTNAWQDPELPARSTPIKPTQALWQNSSR